MPLMVLTESVAQVGAIRILSKPENRGRLILFGGIERVRFRGPVYAGDVVEIEARVKRLRSRMGVFEGLARVGSRVVANGTMTFAWDRWLGSRGRLVSRESGRSWRPETGDCLQSLRRHRVVLADRDAIAAVLLGAIQRRVAAPRSPAVGLAGRFRSHRSWQ